MHVSGFQKKKHDLFGLCNVNLALLLGANLKNRICEKQLLEKQRLFYVSPTKQATCNRQTAHNDPIDKHTTKATEK